MSHAHTNNVRTVGIPVTDQDRAVEFYVDRLGLEKRLDMPLPELGGRWIEVAPSGSEMTLAVILARPDLPSGVQTGIRLGTDDAAALRDDLQGRGVDVGELLKWPGIPPMFTVNDPDGNVLSITEVEPR